MGCCVVFGVVFIISTFALCPLASNWSESTTGVRCVQSTGYVVSGILNLALDVIIVALPLFPVWRLQMATIRKVAISGIFGIGLL
jgi:hypothetical protein